MTPNDITETAIVAVSVLAFTPYAIAGVMLISGKWRISTARKPGALPPVAEIASEPAEAMAPATPKPTLRDAGAA